jgi:hypothetical protein
MADLKDFGPLLDKALAELDRRASMCAKNKAYTRSSAPVPRAVESAKLVNAYQALMGMSQAPWAGLVVESVQDRLEVGGFKTGDKAIDARLWKDVWQANGLDSQAKLAQHSILRDGRAFATNWPGADGQPEIVFDGADQMVVLYAEGRHMQRYRYAAVRRWVDDNDRKQLTLYLRDGIYKFREAKEQTDDPMRVQASGSWWEQREEKLPDGHREPWPVENPFGVLPVVELWTNGELQAGAFPYARGEFQFCHGLLDRINLLTFLGLVVALWMGFPLRYAIGDKILRDDDNNPLPPFASKPDEVVQMEDPNAKIGQLQAADRGNLSIFGELSQLAHVTKTPAHLFPHTDGFSNISADTIRALEGGQNAKVRGIHKPQIGEDHEEVVRTAGLMLPKPIIVPPTAEVDWLDHESRSLAERADAAVKLASIEGMPWTVTAELALQMTQEQIRRAQADGASSVIGRLLAEMPNGNGATPPVPAA